MPIECAYSFKDLYRAAHQREFELEPKHEHETLQKLYALPQAERNDIVKEWAATAGWEVKERKGTDGVAYIAFAPSFKE